MESTNKQVLEFIHRQMNDWPLAAQNYNQFSHTKERIIAFDEFNLIVQFNPERIRSSAAKVDKQSITERKCFLCTENRPAQQEGLEYPGGYTILLNPYPIFEKHLTIETGHIPQRIAGRMGDMLRLAKDLSDFVILYNGPECGASAPDHFHFQAGTKDTLPVESELDRLKKLLYKTNEGCVWTMNNNMHTIATSSQDTAMANYLRKVIIYTSLNPAWVETEFNRMMDAFAKIQPDKPEPMVNILAAFHEDRYTLFVFPRQKHRPSQYDQEGEQQIMFSPGSVDCGGLLVIPRVEDEPKITKETIADMFIQVTLADKEWELLKSQIIVPIHSNKS